MTKRSEDLPTAEAVADALEQAMRRAWVLLPPGRHVLGHEHEVAERRAFASHLGVDERVMHVDVAGWEGTGYRHVVEHAFHVGVEVNVRVGFMQGEGLQVKCEPSWASGPKELDLCIAAAKLHLETCERAAQAQAAMRDAVERIFKGAKGAAAAERFRAGAKLLQDRWDADRDTFGTAWRAKREAEEAHKKS